MLCSHKKFIFGEQNSPVSCCCCCTTLARCAIYPALDTTTCSKNDTDMKADIDSSLSCPQPCVRVATSPRGRPHRLIMSPCRTCNRACERGPYPTPAATTRPREPRHRAGTNGADLRGRNPGAGSGCSARRPPGAGGAAAAAAARTIEHGGKRRRLAAWRRNGRGRRGSQRPFPGKNLQVPRSSCAAFVLC